MSYRETFALIFATVPPIVLAMHEAAFVIAHDKIPPLGWDIALGVAAIFGAVAGLMAVPGQGEPLPAAVVGVAAATGIYGASYGYLYWRETIWNIELAIPLVVGVIPAVVLFAILYARPNEPPTDGAG